MVTLAVVQAGWLPVGQPDDPVAVSSTTSVGFQSSLSLVVHYSYQLSFHSPVLESFPSHGGRGLPLGLERLV